MIRKRTVFGLLLLGCFLLVISTLYFCSRQCWSHKKEKKSQLISNTNSTFTNVISTIQHGNNSESPLRQGEQPPSDRVGAYLYALTNRNVDVKRRMEAAISLGQEKIVTASSQLLTVCKNTSEPIELRYKAARALGVMEVAIATSSLRNIMLDKEENRHLRVISALALGNIGSDACVDALKELYTDDDATLRYKAVQGLDKTGNASAYPSVLGALKDKDRTVQARAIHAIGAVGDDSSVGLLSELIESSDDTFLQIACLTALGQLGGSEAITVLENYRDDSNELLRINAKQIIDKLKRGL